MRKMLRWWLTITSTMTKKKAHIQVVSMAFLGTNMSIVGVYNMQFPYFQKYVFSPTSKFMGLRVINKNFRDVFCPITRKILRYSKNIFFIRIFFPFIVDFFNGILVLFFLSNGYSYRGKVIVVTDYVEENKTYLNVFLYDLINTHTYTYCSYSRRTCRKPQDIHRCLWLYIVIG